MNILYTFISIFFISLFFCHVLAMELPKEYRYMSYQEITNMLDQLAYAYPDLIEIFRGQERYAQFGLDFSLGTCDNMVCEHTVVKLGDRRFHSAETPEVYFSGALHGNEVLGPNVLAYLIQLMTEGYGVDPDMTYFLRSRAIYISPMTNAYGYAHGIREESCNNSEVCPFAALMDPNRDFPYNIKDPSMCMRTQAGRVVNELFREHLFVSGITFHGGMRSLSYEWGSYDHSKLTPDRKYRSEEAPDEIAQKSIGDSMRLAAGKAALKWSPFGQKMAKSLQTVSSSNTNTFATDPLRRPFWYGIYGPMSDTVYPVDGGMEDWSYAASWAEREKVPSCEPRTYKPYAKERTQYEADNVQMLMYLAETDDAKHPVDALFGNWRQALGVDDDADGHVPRNMRMALKTIELADPSLLFKQPPTKVQALVDEGNKTKPSVETQVYPVGCLEANTVALVQIAGECVNVEATEEDFELLEQALASLVPGQFVARVKVSSKIAILDAQFDIQCRGASAWEAQLATKTNDAHRGLVTLTGIINENLKSSTENMCFAVVANFDQNWKNQESPSPQVPPRTHIAQRRLSSDYLAKITDLDGNDHVVQGRVWNFYPPKEVMISQPPVYQYKVSSVDPSTLPQRLLQKEWAGEGEFTATQKELLQMEGIINSRNSYSKQLFTFIPGLYSFNRQLAENMFNIHKNKLPDVSSSPTSQITSLPTKTNSDAPTVIDSHDVSPPKQNIQSDEAVIDSIRLGCSYPSPNVVDFFNVDGVVTMSSSSFAFKDQGSLRKPIIFSIAFKNNHLIVYPVSSKMGKPLYEVPIGEFVFALAVRFDGLTHSCDVNEPFAQHRLLNTDNLRYVNRGPGRTSISIPWPSSWPSIEKGLGGLVLHTMFRAGVSPEAMAFDARTNSQMSSSLPASYFNPVISPSVFAYGSAVIAHTLQSPNVAYNKNNDFLGCIIADKSTQQWGAYYSIEKENHTVSGPRTEIQTVHCRIDFHKRTTHNIPFQAAIAQPWRLSFDCCSALSVPAPQKHRAAAVSVPSSQCECRPGHQAKALSFNDEARCTLGVISHKPATPFDVYENLCGYETVPRVALIQTFYIALVAFVLGAVLILAPAILYLKQRKNVLYFEPLSNSPAFGDGGQSSDQFSLIAPRYELEMSSNVTPLPHVAATTSASHQLRTQPFDINE